MWTCIHIWQLAWFTIDNSIEKSVEVNNNFKKTNIIYFTACEAIWLSIKSNLFAKLIILIINHIKMFYRIQFNKVAMNGIYELLLEIEVNYNINRKNLNNW